MTVLAKGRSSRPARAAASPSSAKPAAANAARLDPKRSPGDAFELRGRDLYLHLPNGVAKTKLTNDYFDRTLATVATVRNWNTVGKLVEMSSRGGA